MKYRNIERKSYARMRLVVLNLSSSLRQVVVTRGGSYKKASMKALSVLNGLSIHKFKILQKLELLFLPLRTKLGP